MKEPASYSLWSAKDVAFLKRHYSAQGSRYVAKRLHRTMKAVRRKARTLGLERQRFRKWNSYEIRYMRQWYAKVGPEGIARRLKHTPAAVRRMASVLSLHTARKDAWAADEIAYVTTHAATTTYRDIARALRRPVVGVQYIVAKLGLRKKLNVHPWTADEKAYIKRMYGKIPNRELCRKFGVNKGQLEQMARRLGLTSPNARPYNEQERNMLRQLYGTMPNQELARRMRRTVGSLEGQARKLGLTGTTPRTPRPMSDREREFISANFASMSLSAIARALGRTRPSVAAYCAKAGLRKHR